MAGIVSRSTFMAGGLARTSFRNLVSAAAAAGYDSMTLWANQWRHAQKRDGLTLPAMRRMLEDHGIAITESEGCSDWLPSARGSAQERSVVSRAEFIDTTAALGGVGITVAHSTGAPFDPATDVPAFAAFCDEAGRAGLRVGLEMVGVAAVRDVAAAKCIVEGSGRANAGYVVDLLHLKRGGGSFDDLRTLPADRIYTVQLCDGPAAAPADLMEEIVYGRRLPGDGDLDAAEFLKVLGEMGVRASLGVEVYRRSFEARKPLDVMRELIASTRAVLAQAGMTLDKTT